MSHQFDATLKEILSQTPADFRQVFHLPAIVPAQTLNVDLSTLSAATDVALGFGDPLQEIVDVNFQSGPDPNVDARLHLYNAAFHLKFKVPVRSLLILLRPKAQTPNLNGKVSYVSGSKRVRFEYDIVRMWREPLEPFLQGGLGTLPLATLCKMPPGKRLKQALRDVVRAIDARLATMPNHATAVRLMTAAFVLTHLRVSRETASNIYEGVTIMHKTTGWDQLIEEGEVRKSHNVLLKLGSQRFGEPDAETESALTAINDLNHLDRMIGVLLKVKSWKALLAVK